jgi:hypothetical protein
MSETLASASKIWWDVGVLCSNMDDSVKTKKCVKSNRPVLAGTVMLVVRTSVLPKCVRSTKKQP